jgi:hypothetical protein
MRLSVIPRLFSSYPPRERMLKSDRSFNRSIALDVDLVLLTHLA